MKFSLELKIVSPPYAAPYPQEEEESDEDYKIRYEKTKDWVFLIARIEAKVSPPGCETLDRLDPNNLSSWWQLDLQSEYMEPMAVEAQIPIATAKALSVLAQGTSDLWIKQEKLNGAI